MNESESISMKFENLTFAFVWSILLAILVIVPEHNLTLPLSIKATFSWMGIIILAFLILKNLLKAKIPEYKALVLYIKGKIPFIERDLIKSEVAERLMLSGLISWLFIMPFKNSFFPLPLFTLGSILLIWGLSIFFEKNGVYKFSESNLSNKWVLSGIGSVILYWASFKSAGQINSVFSMDSGLFPYTLVAMVLVNVIVLFSLIMIPVFIILAFAMIIKFVRKVFGKPKNDESMIFMAVLVFSGYFSIIGLMMQYQKLQDSVVRSIALKTDFNFSHVCEDNWLKDKPVIFIESNSSHVLAQSKKNDKKFEIYKCISL